MAVFTCVKRHTSGDVLDWKKREVYHGNVGDIKEKLEKEGYKQRNGKVVDGIMYFTMEKIMKQRRKKSG